MGTTADKLEYLSDTKELIRQAIIDKGVQVDLEETFRSYPDKISQIETGGSSWVDFFTYLNMRECTISYDELDIFIAAGVIEEVVGNA